MESGSLTGPIVLARTRAPDLESVRKLNCWGSEIEDISVVKQMPNLEVCSVSVNDITTLAHFAFCPNLQELYIRKNKIQDLSEICHLKKLHKLRNLWLADNPCAENNNYRMTVLRNLPNLQKLDNVAVLEDEVNRAMEEGEELCLPKPTENSTETELDHNTEEEKPTTPKHSRDDKLIDPVTLSWEETNKIREELGLKPLPIDKICSPMSAPTAATRARNAHILQAVLILIKDLDRDSLEIVDTAIRKRLSSM